MEIHFEFQVTSLNGKSKACSQPASQSNGTGNGCETNQFCCNKFQWIFNRVHFFYPNVPTCRAKKKHCITNEPQERIIFPNRRVTFHGLLLCQWIPLAFAYTVIGLVWFGVVCCLLYYKIKSILKIYILLIFTKSYIPFHRPAPFIRLHNIFENILKCIAQARARARASASSFPNGRAYTYFLLTFIYSVWIQFNFPFFEISDKAPTWKLIANNERM